MSDDNALQAAGKLEFSDVVRFQYFHQTCRRRYLAIFSILVPLFCLFGFAAVLSTGNVERIRNPGWFYIIMFFLVLLQWVIPYFGARRHYAKLQYLREPMRY